MKNYRILKLVALTAAAVLALGVLASCNWWQTGPTVYNGEAKAFASHAALEKYVKDNTSTAKRGGWFSGGIAVNDSADNAAPEASDGDSGSSQTNTQVAGVDESDIVKVYGGMIYTLTYSEGGAAVSIFDTVSGKSLAIDAEGYYPTEFYVQSGRLVVFGVYYDQNAWGGYAKPDIDMADAAVTLDCLWYGGNVSVRIYDVSKLDIGDADSVTLERSIDVPNSSYMTSRRIDDTVYLVLSSFRLFARDNKVYIPQYSDSAAGGELTELSPDSIYLTPHGKDWMGYIYLITFDITEDEVPADIGAYLGGAQHVYASAEALYTAFSYYDYYYYENTPTLGRQMYRTVAVRFEMKPEGLRYGAKLELNGYLHNQFSMDEYDNSFRIVVTENKIITPQSWQVGRATYLHIFGIEGGKFVHLAKSASMGEKKNEIVYSVRFDGETCNVVTAENIDPLYVLDLSDKTNPVILDELESEGVNDYLHKISDELLLGIGRDSNQFGGFTGVKFSLYHNVKPLNELQKYSHDGNSYSQAAYNHKSILAYPTQDGQSYIFGLPVSGWVSSNRHDGYYYTYRSQLLVTRLSTDIADYDTDVTQPGELKVKVLEFPYEENDPWAFADGVRRAVIVNGVLYSVGNTKILAYNLGDFSVAATYAL